MVLLAFLASTCPIQQRWWCLCSNNSAGANASLRLGVDAALSSGAEGMTIRQNGDRIVIPTQMQNST